MSSQSFSRRRSSRSSKSRVSRRRWESLRADQTRFRFEALENRLLMAADLGDEQKAWYGSEATGLLQAAPVTGVAFGAMAANAGQFERAEGEAAVDLVGFAKALAASGTTFYGAAWCPACKQQKDLFEDGYQFLPFVEVTNLDNPVTLNAIGTAEGIESFPTWKFPDGSRVTGAQSLETLSQRSGVAIPSSDQPSIAPIDDGVVAVATNPASNDRDADGDEIVTLLGGSPMHIPIDGYDPGGGPLTYTVTSSNPSLVTPTLLTGNRSLVFDVTGWGKMNFQLFEDRAPRPTARLIELAQSGFYSNIQFHRIVNGFVIQAGDPTATGSGGSTLGDFDDQFHEELQHNRAGVLSYAKSSDDTNDSQFFITEAGDASLRNLDGNHSVAGILVEGETVREAISNNSTTNPRTVVISSATVTTDTENRVVMLKAAEGATGTANITVTATDQNGNQVSRTFTVNVQPDTVNTRPWLQDIAPITVLENTSLSVPLQAKDVEKNPIRFGVVTPTNFTITVPTTSVTPTTVATANITVTPDADFVGTEDVTFFAYDPSDPSFASFNPSTATAALLRSNSSLFDVQTVTVSALANDLTIDLAAESDTGTSSTDNITNLTNLVFNISGVTTGATVTVRAGSTVIGTGPASGTSISVPTNLSLAGGNGVYPITATQTVQGLTSNPSPVLEVTYDAVPPSFTSTAPTAAFIGQTLVYDANTDAEAAGASYVLVNPTTGTPISPVAGSPVINPVTGSVSWTPQASDVGTRTIGIRAADLAGNTATQTVTLNVTEAPAVRFRLEAVKGGNPISATNPLLIGDSFQLNVYVQDVRTLANPAQGGIFSAYLDVLFDSSLATVSGNLLNGPLYQPTVPNAGVVSAGLIDHGGSFTTNLTPPGQTETLLFTAPMTAQGSGTLTFRGEPTTDSTDPGDAGQSPFYDTGLYGQDPPVKPSTNTNATGTMAFVNTSVTINASFSFKEFTFQPDEDSQANPINITDVTNNPRGRTLTFTGTPTADSGTVTIANNGTQLRYTPNANHFGADVVRFSVTDGTETLSSTQAFTVFNKNDAPNAVNDTATVGQNTSTPTFIDVLANDLAAPDPTTEKSQFRIDSVQSPTPNGGIVTITAAGQGINYTPRAGFSGTDVFSYTLSDRDPTSPLTDTATVTVTVTDVNDPPNAVNDTFGTTASPITEDSTDVELNVLANDTIEPDTGETLTITAVTQPANGTVRISTDGSRVLYTPNANFFGEDSFTYTIRDSNASPLTDTANVVVNVAGANDPPNAVDDGAVGNELAVQQASSNNSLNLLANDSSAPDGPETLTITAVSEITGGATVQIATDGRSVLYTPGSAIGTASFKYTISDGNGGTDTAMVFVKVVEFQPSSLGGFVYLDSDNDGLFDTGERALAGVTVNLVGTGPNNSSISRSAQTSADGSYNFTNLPPGPYALRQVQPATNFDSDGVPLVDGKDTIGSQGGTVANDEFVITVAAGTVGINNNFGELKGRSLSVSVGSNGNGSAANQNPIQGLQLELWQNGQVVRDGTRTGVNGSANFAGLTPGQYRLRVTAPFLQETLQDVTVSDANGSATVTIESPQLRPVYPSYLDSLSSRAAQFVSLAASPTTTHWQSLGPGWQSVTELNARITENATGLFLSMRDNTGLYEGTIPLTNRLIQVLNTLEDGTRRMRLNGNPAAFKAILEQLSATVQIAKGVDGDENGPVNATFTVTQTDERTADTVISYTVGGSATEGTDYTALPTARTITIPAGQRSATLTIPVLNDTTAEQAETVTISLGSITSGGAGLTIDTTRASATADIRNASVVSIVAGQDGREQGPANGAFTVQLDRALPAAATVNYTVSGTGTSATDFTALAGSVTIPAGQTSVSLPVTVLDDNNVEGDETVIVTLTTASTGTIPLVVSTAAANATIKIIDAEAVRIGSPSNAEEDRLKSGEFTVTLTGPSSTDTVVSYTTSGTATPAVDYNRLPGTVTIPAGQISAKIPVNLIEDSVDEFDETVIVTLNSITSGNPALSIDMANSVSELTVKDRTVIAGEGEAPTAKAHDTLWASYGVRDWDASQSWSEELEVVPAPASLDAIDAALADESLFAR